MAGSKSVRLFLLGDNKDAKAKIDEIDLKADELAEKHPELKIGIDMAKAQAEMAVLRAELRGVTKDSDGALGSIGNVAKGVAALGGSILGLSAAVPIIASAGAATLAIGSAATSAGLGIGVFGAVAKTLFTDYAKQITTVTKAMDNISNGDQGKKLAADLKSIDAATKGLNPGIRSFVINMGEAKSMWHQFTQEAAPGVAKTLADGIQYIPDALEKLQTFLPGVERALSGVFKNIGKSLDSGELGHFLDVMAKESGPAISKLAGIFGHLASMAMKAMVALTPLGDHVLAKIDGFLAKADSGTNSGLQKFMTFVSEHGAQVAESGKNIAEALGNIGKGLAGMSGFSLSLLTPLTGLIKVISSNPIGADALAGLLVLSKLGGLASVGSALVEVGKGIKAIATAERTAAIASALLEAASGPIGLIFLGIGLAVLLVVTHFNTFKRVATDVWRAVTHAAQDAFNWIKHNWPLVVGILTGPIGLAIAEIIQHWRTVTRVFSEVINWVKSHWHQILAWLVDPIGMAVMEIRTHTHQISQAFDKARHEVAAILAGLRHDIASAFDTVRHDIAAFADWVPHEIAHLWDEARHLTASGLDQIRHAIATAWDWLRHETASLVNDVVRFFQQLPGKITGVLRALPGEMLNIGRNIIEGLIHGIESAASAIPGIMKGLASDVASYFTNPLKIFSPSRVFMEHGANIVMGAVMGIQATAPQLRQAMTRLGETTGAAGLVTGGLNSGRGLTVSVAGAAHSGSAPLQVEWVGGGGADQEFITWLKKQIRIRGGNPAVLGR